MINEITVEYGYTKNLGNYESERLSVGVKMAVGPDQATEVIIQEAFSALKEFVYEKLEIRKKENIDEISEVLSPPTTGIRRRKF
jgi:hypothetical protein